MRNLSRPGFVLLTALTLLAWSAVALGEDPPLTNADVIALHKADLSDDLVIAKIKQARRVEFQLAPEALVALRDQGVGDRIITAMLERSTPSGAPPPTPVSLGSSRTLFSPFGVSLADREGFRSLNLQYGTVTSTGYGPFQFRWLNVSGLRAPVRTTDRNSALVVRSEIDPSTSEEFVLVKLEKDDDDKVRSLKLGRGRFFRTGVTERFKADRDYVLSFTASPEGQGAWRLKPTSQLEPGEYGLFTGLVGVFGFGVDD